MKEDWSGGLRSAATKHSCQERHGRRCPPKNNKVAKLRFIVGMQALCKQGQKFERTTDRGESALLQQV